MSQPNDAPDSPGPGPTAHVLILHAVADYGAWKRVFDSAATMRKEAGELSYQVLRDREDANSVVHFSAWTTHADAMRFFQSPELEEIRRKAGVSAPTFHYLLQLERGVLQASPGSGSGAGNQRMITLRRPREALAGCLWLPRFIDKCRLHSAGVLPPDYRMAFCSSQGIDGIFLAHFGLTAEEAQAAIGKTGTDEEVSLWFRAQPGVTPEAVRCWNELAPDLGKPGFPGERGFLWARRHFLAGCTDPGVVSGFTAIAWDEGFSDEAQPIA